MRHRNAALCPLIERAVLSVIKNTADKEDNGAYGKMAAGVALQV